MIRRRSHIKKEPNTKKYKSNESDETINIAPANSEQSVSNQNPITNKYEAECEELVPPELDEQSPDIYKLPVELMMEIFNFLALDDLNSVCKTSKWWRKIARACFQQNYSYLYAIYLGNRLEKDRLDAFKPLFQRVLFNCRRDFKYFLNNEFEFHQLRKMSFCFVQNLAQLRYENMENKVFSKLECLKFVFCNVEPELIERMLALAPNLKHLRLMEDHTTLKDSKWLLRKYPSLNRFGIVTHEILPITRFLKLNPNIRYLEVNSANLWKSRHLLRTSQITLDDLAVLIDSKKYIEKSENHTKMSRFAPICRLLNELHELGIYKRLKLYIEKDFKQEMVDEVASLNALTKFHIGCMKHGPFALSSLRRIQELTVGSSTHIDDTEAMAEELVDLKLINIVKADISSIMPLIRRATKLEKIRMESLQEHEVIDLAALNRERSKLPNVKKLTLYVYENVFLAIKRTGRGTDSDFIKIQRISSIECDHDFV